MSENHLTHFSLTYNQPAQALAPTPSTADVLTLERHEVPVSTQISAGQDKEQALRKDGKDVTPRDAQEYLDAVSRPSSPFLSAIRSESFILKPSNSIKSPASQRRGAWMYLGGMFILETIIWGFAGSYGVLLDHYLHSRFAKEPSAPFLLPLVGTVNTGLMALLIPVISVILNRYPNFKATVMYVGLAVTSLSLFLSSYSTHSIHVLLTLGIGYGFGGVAVYYPALTYLPEWFPERPGLANGIVFSGNGLGGLMFPFILDRLLRKCGLELALRYLTILIVVTVGISLNFVRPVPATSNPRIKSCESIWQAIGDRRALKASALWLFVIANTLQALAYFLPSLYLPNFAHDQGLPSYSGTTFLAALNIANIVSRLTFGTLSDYIPTHIIGGMTSLVAAISTVVFWGLLETQDLKNLICLSIFFGGTSGAWTSLYFSVIKEWKVDERTTMTVYSVLSMTRGLANILAGPISSSLLKPMVSTASKNGFSSPYSGVIWFCSANMFATAAVEVIVYIQHLHSKHRKSLAHKSEEVK
ncbi:hypothetical protein CROQUDRAFT_673722 [Cronartium quercuum f. sp. fusiforme G11]|uniref:Uncharacterized protein n=1 Tax=Cronartium quercuum f. sp. fusiforme G11 TaxID=708437 RepID=A0A9P6NA35_9BASI|nr:hypothetical protein CROQUDRAFT_673722 [Cronartium quercuum f. sp. fusiforme G11]